MKRIIAVEPGEWVILPCILETDDCYYRVDVYPDGRVEASDDERFAKEHGPLRPIADQAESHPFQTRQRLDQAR